LDAVIEEGEEVVGNDAFEGFAVKVAETEPETIEFGAAEKGFAFRLEVVGEVADKVDGANGCQGKFLMFAVGGEEVEGINLSEARGIQVAANGFFIGQNDNDLFVRGGWGAIFQFSVGPIFSRSRAVWDKICQAMKSMLC
jgi:hypothetical protein